MFEGRGLSEQPSLDTFEGTNGRGGVRERNLTALGLVVVLDAAKG